MKLVALLFLIPIFVIGAGFAQSPSPIPPVKQISMDDALLKIGACTLLSDAKDQRIAQLENTIKLIATELEDLKKTAAKPTEAKKGQ